MKKTAFLGIDPGKNGALCCLSYPDLDYYDFKHVLGVDLYLVRLKRKFDVKFAVLEKVWLWKNEKDFKTAEVLIRNSEMWITLLQIHGIPFLQSAPANWRKGLIKGAPSKSKFMKKAIELFPESAGLITRHDRAEAALLAYRAHLHIKAGAALTI